MINQRIAEIGRKCDIAVLSAERHHGEDYIRFPSEDVYFLLNQLAERDKEIERLTNFASINNPPKYDGQVLATNMKTYWIDTFYDGGFCINPNTITHWTPLPELPRKG